MRCHTIPLRLLDLEGNGFHILVEINIFKETHFAVVDTGASKSVFDKEFIFQKAVHTSVADNIQANTLFSTSETLQANIPVFQIGSLKIKDLEILAIDLSSVSETYAQLGHPPIVGIIGGDILVNYHAIINYQNAFLRLYK